MEQPADEPEVTAEASYAVGPPAAAGARTPLCAVFLTHGMGQQIPFQTIDQVATSLRTLDIERGNPEWKPIGRTTRSGENPLTRIELRLKSKTKPVEVHLYEGYWAPLTEGRITARNVIGFLAGAGLNGLRHIKGLRRWLFGNYPEAPMPVRQVFFLLAALLTVASLVVMNSAIALVAAARALLGVQPSWLSDNLFADLTTTFNLVVVAMGLFGLLLAASALVHKFPRLRSLRKPMGVVTAFLFVVVVLVVILAGAGIPFLFYGHVRDLVGESQVWYERTDPALVDAFNAMFDAIGLRAALIVALIVAIRWISRLGKGFLRDLEDRKTAMFTIAVTLGFVLLLAGVVWITVFFVRLFATNRPEESAFAQHVAWPLLVLASAYVRLVLMQFVGDVAIYVMPYKLDAFNDLRREIKKRVYDAARAVYAERVGEDFAYDKVIVVGHSLGSVIAYDTLNQLILEDESPQVPPAPGVPARTLLRVTERTPLFLTFGSPLDKTAFLFAVQAEGTSEAREALAASVQPLILSYPKRPKRWINIWSPWDIISGPLDLYDYPLGAKDDANTQRVQNERDPDATTLLIAHTEYWKNPLVVGTLYDAIEAA